MGDRPPTETFDAAWWGYALYPVGFLVVVTAGSFGTVAIALTGAVVLVGALVQLGFLLPFRIELDDHELRARFLWRRPWVYALADIRGAATYRLNPGWLIRFSDGNRLRFLGNRARLRAALQARGVETANTFFGYG